MKYFIIGVPRERKAKEGRVGITPKGVLELRRIGEYVEVWVELGAGRLAGFSDNDYLNAGARLIPTPDEIYATADVVVKVKEPIPEEYPLLLGLKGKTLFTYLHLAGVDPELTRVLLRNEITAIAYENVEVERDGRRTFPLLAPMSRIAGTQAMKQALAHCYALFAKEGQFAMSTIHPVILGGGVVGEAALVEALRQGVSDVTLFELRPERVLELRALYEKLGVRVFPMKALHHSVGARLLGKSRIVISGVMSPGGSQAPHVLCAREFALMQKGCYVVDVAIDQGGSTEWSRPTSPGETFERDGLIFSCVANIPGSTVPQEATLALTEATLPYIQLIVEYSRKYPESSAWWLLKEHLTLRKGLQTWKGSLVNKFVSSQHQLFAAYKSIDEIF